MESGFSTAPKHALFQGPSKPPFLSRDAPLPQLCARDKEPQTAEDRRHRDYDLSHDINSVCICYLQSFEAQLW